MLREDFYVADTFGLALDNPGAFGMKSVKSEVTAIVSWCTVGFSAPAHS